LKEDLFEGKSLVPVMLCFAITQKDMNSISLYYNSEAQVEKASFASLFHLILITGFAY
jgi:hypothetical protein